MVLQAEGDLPPVCTAGHGDDFGEKEYRECSHYDALLRGGLIQIVRRSKKRTGKGVGRKCESDGRSALAAEPGSGPSGGGIVQGG